MLGKTDKPYSPNKEKFFLKQHLHEASLSEFHHKGSNMPSGIIWKKVEICHALMWTYLLEVYVHCLFECFKSKTAETNAKRESVICRYRCVYI